MGLEVRGAKEGIPTVKMTHGKAQRRRITSYKGTANSLVWLESGM